MSETDQRLRELREWSAGHLGVADPKPRPASEDASFRRYFRVEAGARTYIVMDAPPRHEPVAAFVRIATGLLEIGLNVPRIMAVDEARGYVLMSDLGTTTYLDRLSPDTADGLYSDAVDALVALQAGGRDNSGFLPDAERALWLRQMSLFDEWYVRRHLGQTLSADQRAHLDIALSRLCDNACEQPRVWVHMDFHSRNLMVTAPGNPGVLDFQDAVNGPVSYDAVSLFRDCYLYWPRERVEGWAGEYFSRAHARGLPVGGDFRQFLRWFDLMGLQRHIKVLGIFSRLFYRDGKDRYLADIPRVYRYALGVATRYPELDALAALLHALPPAERS